MMSKRVYKVRMNCVGLADYGVIASNKEEARRIVENSHHQCDGTEFEFGEFLDIDDTEKTEIRDYTNNEPRMVVPL